MAAAPIDLSAGLVPKAADSIDLSSGLVPKADAAPQPSSLSQFIDAALPASGISGMGHMLAHPYDTVKNLVTAGNPADTTNPINQAVVGAIENAKTEGKSALDMAKQGQYGAAAEHAIQAVPIVGQLAKSIGDEIPSQGNGYGQMLGSELKDPTAMGSIVGTALSPAVGEATGAALNNVVPAANRALLLGKTPEAAYESAIKLPIPLGQADRARVIQTGLSEGIPVSKGGLEKLGDLIDGYNQKISDTIAQDPTRPIDPNAVATRADIAKAKFAQQVNAQSDLNAIEASRQQFLTQQGAKPGVPSIPPHPTGLLDEYGKPIMNGGTPAVPSTPAPPMSAADAQAFKQGTYGILKGKYGEVGSADTEAQKALARGLKEELANQFPEINNLNASESKLLDLQPYLERAVNRNGNHQMVGIGTPIVGAATTAITKSSGWGAAASAIKGIVDNPMIKSRLAIAISKGGNIPYATALGKVGAYSATLGNALSSTPSDSGQSSTQ